MSDLFLINGSDGISLSEMIDWDIKLSNPEISEEVGVNSLMGLGYDFPLLDIEDELSPTIWTQMNSNNSNSSFELDFLGEGGSSVIVNPSSVVPFISTRRGSLFSKSKASDNKQKSPDKTNEQSTINSSEQNKFEFCDLKSEKKSVEDVDEDDQEPTINVEIINDKSVFEEVQEPTEIDAATTNEDDEVKPQKKTSTQKWQVDSTKVYPKPAYSYSCLIAMALKNSHKGSLPVSEIYSFMCHHFPYFKTAPSGWKNSVRHNLSLSKCFEKIEKPPAIGSNGSQRKGCLWAMNPLKISKMDEEVAKWSKKDPFAIKDAMIYPDNLELLERGELKDDAAFADTDLEDDEAKEEDTGDELGADIDDERISPIDDDSEDESRVPPSLLPFEPKFRNSLVNINVESKENHFNTYDETATRSILGLDDSTPIYAVDPTNENVLIELPIVKKPRVQNNYVYQPVIDIKPQHSFRTIRIESP